VPTVAATIVDVCTIVQLDLCIPKLLMQRDDEGVEGELGRDVML
tara:strand:- start:1751 stop:1882 length:132 start_codon:yes stop_codon:yes gene_type:complete